MAEGGCRGDLPCVQGVSITPGALSAWHGGSVDFSSGDSEIITGLWQAHPAQPLSGVFCRFIFANIAMPLVVPPRTGAAVPPCLLSPPPLCHCGDKTPAEPSQERHTVPPVFCRTRLWKEVLYLQSFSCFCNILPSAHPTSRPTSKTSVALNHRIRGKSILLRNEAFFFFCTFLTMACKMSCLLEQVFA